MNQSNRRHVVDFQLRSWPLRILWLLGSGFLLAWGLMSLYHDFRGKALATVDPTVEGLQEAAQILPFDPEVQHQLGLLYLFDPLLLDADRARFHLQRAVEQSPVDLNLWIDLGRAYEQQGQSQPASESYQKAIALAPTYFRPRWIDANFLLRSNRTEEGLNEFVHLLEADSDPAPHIFDLVWQASGGNNQVLVAFGGRLRSEQARAELANFLAQRGRYGEALAIWNRIASDSKFKVESGLELIPKLVETQQWEQAARIWQQTLAARFGDRAFGHMAFFNGGFEQDPMRGGFDWALESTPDVEIALDSGVSQEGARALQLRFLQHEDVQFGGVYHQVLVRPSTDYVLQFQYKTDGMLARNGLAIEVTDAQQPARLRVRSEPLHNPTEWTLVTLPFHTSEDTRVIGVRILRQPIDKLHDYIAGQVWFDSFTLQPH